MPNPPLTFKHSFNSGDLISILPGIKHLYEVAGQKAIIYQRLNLPADYSHSDNHPIKDDNGRQVCMNEEMFSMMKPLVEAQEYVEKFEIWNGEKVDFDFDMTRWDSRMPLPGGDLHYWPTLIFPQLLPKVDEPWINVPPYMNTGKFILINRTERYQNPYIDFHFLKKYNSGLFAFIGTDEERNIFCKQWDIDIPHVIAESFYVLAMGIRSCRFFIGNQSLCWHLADAMKVPRILEVCTQYPNTFPTGEDGYAFISQVSLEFYFEKLSKETE